MPAPYAAVKEVNAYLVLGERPTLIDGGPWSPPAATAVDAALRDRGMGPGNLGLILLTHHHSDHAGLAGWLHERGGAPVAAIEPVARHLAAVAPELDKDEAFARELMRCHGFDDASARAMIGVEDSYRRYHREAVVDEIVPVGGRIAAGDRELTIHLRPGHSPFDTVFHDERDGLLVVGDHLLAHVASSPYLHCPAGADDPVAAAAGGLVPSPLPRYLDSLRATADLDATLVLPGHGPVFGDHRDLIATRFEGYETRRERLLDHLHQPLTARALIAELWPRLPDDRLYLAFSEVLGVLELLLRDGLVRRSAGGPGPVTFCATASSAARGPR